MAIPSLGVRVSTTKPQPSAPEHARLLVALARASEQAGAEAFFVDDAKSPDGAHDPFVLLGAIAAATSTILLGCLANRLGRREPSMVAKSIASLDVLSEGRAIGCLGLRGASERDDPLGELAEALIVVRLMLDVRGASFSGAYFSIRGAFNEPRSERDDPLPLGALIPLNQPTQSVSGSLPVDRVTAALSGAGFIVTEPRGAPAVAESVVPLIALIESKRDDPRNEVATRAKRAADAGYAGVILDWPISPSIDHLVDVIGECKSVKPN